MPHREVEQADRVAPAREQHEHRPARAAAGADRARSPRAHGSAAGEEQLGRLVEALELDLADRLEREVRARPPPRPSRVTSTSPPAARAPTRDGEVDRAAVVVAVAVERRGRRAGRSAAAAAPACSAWKPTAQSTSADGSEPTTITSSPIVLITRASSGSVSCDRLDEALDDLERLLLARLLGQPRVAREVGERDRRRAARPSSASVGLEPRGGRRRPARGSAAASAGARASMIGAASGSSSRGEARHLLGDLQARRAVADHRLVDEEVEELDLGVGDLRQRLAVDAHELQEGDEREPGVEHRRHVAQQLQVVLGDALERRRPRSPAALQIRSISAGSSPVSRAASRERVRAPAGGREEVLEVAVGEPARLRGARAAASSECPRARRRATSRACASAAGVHSPSPSGTIPSATQRRSVAGGHVEPAGDVGERRDPASTPRMKAAGPRSWSRRLRAMRPAASAGGVRPKATPCG